MKFAAWNASRILLTSAGLLIALASDCLAGEVAPQDDLPGLTDREMKLVRQIEQKRINVINQVMGSVVAIYDDDRQGGGSGVIIDPSGIALTNHHVIMGAGVKGWAGIADGKLYRWELIGTDPGGDVAIVQLQGRNDFPSTPLGDSDNVRVGDWALAMGNPFILTEDQKPTITLGIVSGVKRYQPGAGNNQLVYGNCIQVDSSINPGNSGGPLFSFEGRVIGINGRGSFKERGRVNVGLGYAISSNQIKNFIPDLLATKLVEHATIDANFEDRQGKVICVRRNTESPVAQAGLQLSDELITFEGIPINSANQYTNLLCTLPEDWPIEMTIRKPDGQIQTIHTRAIGLPYARPRRPNKSPKDGKNPAEKKAIKRQLEMYQMLAATPGQTRFRAINRRYAGNIWSELSEVTQPMKPEAFPIELSFDLKRGDQAYGQWQITIQSDRQLRVSKVSDGSTEIIEFRDGKLRKQTANEAWSEMTLVEAKLDSAMLLGLTILSGLKKDPLAIMGKPLIDGSGKALRQNAYRMKLMDPDGDPLFAWVSMYGDGGLPEHRLLKLAADRNCRDGGIALEEWQVREGLSVPSKIRVVTGLAEATVLTAQLIDSDVAAKNTQKASQ